MVKNYDCIEHLQKNEDKDGQRMYIETEKLQSTKKHSWNPSKLAMKYLDNVIKNFK